MEWHTIAVCKSKACSPRLGTNVEIYLLDAASDWASPKPFIILSHISAGLKPFFLICPIILDIIFDIILGIAFVTKVTKSPPPIALRIATNTYFLEGEPVIYILITPF